MSKVPSDSFDEAIGSKDNDIYSQVGAGLGAVGAAVLGPVVQVIGINQFLKIELEKCPFQRGL